MNLPDQPEATLRAALAGLLPAGCAVCVARPEPDDDPAGARLAEFHTGRRLAAAALSELGAQETHVGRGADRAPLWPDGFAGSIAHSGGLCVAAAAPGHAAAALGIDIEPLGAVEAGLVEIIATPQEAARIATHPDPALARTVLFCAKEAAYKCQYPLTGRMLEFHEVAIRPGARPGALAATVRPDDAGLALTLDGGFATAAGFVVAAFFAPPSLAPGIRAAQPEGSRPDALH